MKMQERVGEGVIRTEKANNSIKEHVNGIFLPASTLFINVDPLHY